MINKQISGSVFDTQYTTSPKKILSLNIVFVCLIFGIGLGGCVYQLPPLGPVVIVWSALVLAILLSVYFRRPMFIYLLCFICGGYWSISYGHQLKQARLSDQWAGRDWLVEGAVINLPKQHQRYIAFDFLINRIIEGPDETEWSNNEPGNKKSIRKIRLNYYSQPWQKFDIKAGQYWRLRVRLKPPRGFVNPGGFDYEGWLLGEGYHATGYVRKDDRNILLANGISSSVYSGFELIKIHTDRVRGELQQVINQRVGDRYRGFFSALVLGNQNQLTHEHWELLRDTGTIHLVVVSGLHIGLMAGIGYGLFLFISRRLYFPLLCMPAQCWAALGGLACAGAYVLISGCSLPTQRALIMVACGLLGIILRRNIAPLTIFLLAALLVLIYDPLSIFSPGFWLSFGAVATLWLLFFSRIQTESGKPSNNFSIAPFLMPWVKTQWFISIGLIPFLVIWIGSVPLVMPLSNLLAVPWASLLMIPVVIFSCVCSLIFYPLIPSIAEFLVYSAEKFIFIFEQWLRFCVNLNINIVIPDSLYPNTVILCLALIAIFMLLLPGYLFVTTYIRYILVSLLMTGLLFPAQELMPENEFKVTILDVGQGLSAVIKTRNHQLVYDVGDRFSDKFDIGRDVVANYFLKSGLNEVDLMVISHSDRDHAGGTIGFLSKIHAKQIIAGNHHKIRARLDRDSYNQNLKHLMPCRAGQRWTYDGVTIQILSPLFLKNSALKNKHMSFVNRNSNNASCVLRVSNGVNSILLAGDIHKDMEYFLVRHYADQLSSQLLLVPHHGSFSSSSKIFLQAVKPESAVVSVGYRSRYGHPHPKVIQRYQQLDIPVWRTDLHGALQFTSQDQFAQPVSSRTASNRYWHRW